MTPEEALRVLKHAVSLEALTEGAELGQIADGALVALESLAATLALQREALRLAEEFKAADEAFQEVRHGEGTRLTTEARMQVSEAKQRLFASLAALDRETS